MAFHRTEPYNEFHSIIGGGGLGLGDNETGYGDYLKTWLKSSRYNMGSQTMKVHESLVRQHIIPRLGHFTISQLKTIVLQDFINALMDDGLANASVRRIFSVASSSLDSAERMQFIAKNPASLVTQPRLLRKHLQVWTPEQVRYFLALSTRDPYTHVAFHLALLTGMRQGEILGLRWRDVNLTEQPLHIHQTLSSDGREFLAGAKTRSGFLSVAIDNTTTALLQSHLRRIETDKSRDASRYQDEGLVVCDPYGQRVKPKRIWSVWFRLLKESGLPKITFHDLRHTHASLLLKNNVHPKIVSERLGHSSIQITLDTYSHLLPNMQKYVAEKLGDVLFGQDNTK